MKTRWTLTERDLRPGYEIPPLFGDIRAARMSLAQIRHAHVIVVSIRGTTFVIKHRHAPTTKGTP